MTIADRNSELILGKHDEDDDHYYYSSDPMFADCPLQSVYIGGNISYSTDANRGY